MPKQWLPEAEGGEGRERGERLEGEEAKNRKTIRISRLLETLYIKAFPQSQCPKGALYISYV